MSCCTVVCNVILVNQNYATMTVKQTSWVGLFLLDLGKTLEPFPLLLDRTTRIFSVASSCAIVSKMFQNQHLWYNSTQSIVHHNLEHLMRPRSTMVLYSLWSRTWTFLHFALFGTFVLFLVDGRSCKYDFTTPTF